MRSTVDCNHDDLEAHIPALHTNTFYTTYHAVASFEFLLLPAKKFKA